MEEGQPGSSDLSRTSSSTDIDDMDPENDPWRHMARSSNQKKNATRKQPATARSCPKGREVETIQTYSKANSVDFHAAKSALELEELFPALEFTPADSSVTKELAAASGFKDIAGNKDEHSKKPTALATPYASALKATKPKAPKSQGVRQGSTSQGIQMSDVSETPPPETTQSDLQLSTVRQRRQVRETDAKPSRRNTHLTCLSILQWNARGLRRRLPDLRQQLIHSPADVLAIQEPMTRPGDFRFFPYVIHHTAGPLKDPITAIASALSLSTRTIKVPLRRPAPDLVYLNLRAARRRAQRKARRTKDPKDWNTHHKIDAKFRRHTLNLQRKQWGQLCASFGSADVRETLPDLPRKKDIHPTVARTAVAVALRNEYVEHLEVYTDGSVDKKRGTATAAYTIPAISTESAVLLNIETSSTTAETVAILLALTALQERPAIGKAVILTDSRSALVHIANREHAPLIAQEAAHIATKLEDNGWRLVFQWVPSHSGILGNERADTLATRAHNISTTTHNLRRFHEARLLIARDLRKRHPDPGTANGEGPVPVPTSKLTRKDATLLHRVRTNSAFTRKTLHRFGRTSQRSSADCTACGEVEDINHILWHCPEYEKARKTLLASVRATWAQVSTTEELLFPTGGKQRARVIFRAVLEFAHVTEISDRL
ncbi:hypothetical protein HPB47_014335 [Ixodes persulcatus]|uniref:Uncharacterized protein n=1 Tax=Ixodes persulcatus TaxID=34615 RepID=A0AC60QYU4_IXOPE|nr:hypothetical protein HPB47_014335 [Ixodes persulcatus]